MRRLCGRRLGCSLAVLSPVLLLLLPLLSGADTREAALEAFGLQVFQSGITAPDFTATDVHGQQVQLAAYRGKVVLLVFWATW